MLLTKKVKVKLVRPNIREHYGKFGYNINSYEIEVKVEDLLKNSHVLVDVKCDICGCEKQLKYFKYYKNYNKHKIYCCSNKCAQIKNKKTNTEKYGVEHYSKTKKHRERVRITSSGINETKYEDRKCVICEEKFKIRKKKHKLTCSKVCYLIYTKSNEYKKEISEKTKKSVMKKYGVENQFQRKDIIDKLRIKRIESGIETPEENLKEWELYKRIVNRLTRQNKKDLILNWNGYDYYDDEYILNNFSLNHLDKSYPTIDHKISVFEGFKNRILPEIISNIDNLCVTKRSNNAKKGIKNKLN